MRLKDKQREQIRINEIGTNLKRHIEAKQQNLENEKQKMDDYKRSLEEKEIDQNWKMDTERQRIEKQRKIDDEQQGSLKYYVIKILAHLDPTHLP